jgi:NAD(P)-dependent dehydrogenase (short-subunit alcohol dehydrogenase family)
MKNELRYDNELSGKITLVTVGTKGAGKAIAHRLNAAGATVIITARNKQDDDHEDVMASKYVR